MLCAYRCCRYLWRVIVLVVFVITNRTHSPLSTSTNPPTPTPTHEPPPTFLRCICRSFFVVIICICFGYHALSNIPHMNRHYLTGSERSLTPSHRDPQRKGRTLILCQYFKKQTNKMSFTQLFIIKTETIARSKSNLCRESCTSDNCFLAKKMLLLRFE